MRYAVGIDDSGTGKRLLDGWAYFGLPQSSLSLFENKANAILLASKPRLKSFHGKEARKRDQASFHLFLTLIQSTLMTEGFCWFALNDRDWRDEVNASANRVIAGALNQQGIADANFISTVPPLAPCLASVAKQSVALGANSCLHLHVAADDSTRALVEASILVRGIQLSAVSALQAYYRAFREKRYPDASSIDSIQFIQAKDSLLIQAADVIAHFALAYLFASKGHSSGTKKWKAEMFRDIFSEIDATKVIDALTVVDDDLILKPSGMIVLDMEVVECPDHTPTDPD